MRARLATMLLAGGLGLLGMGAASTPAEADRYWRHGPPPGHYYRPPPPVYYGPPPVYYRPPPPVYYRPPPPVFYRPPPPVYYGPPGVGFGVFIR